jgi:hypothetical protein
LSIGWGNIRPVGKPFNGYGAGMSEEKREQLLNKVQPVSVGVSAMKRCSRIVSSMIVAEDELRDYGYHKILNRPSLTPTGMPEFSPAEFNRVLDEFLAYVNDLIMKYMQKDFPTLPIKTVSVMHGQRYVRLVESDGGGGRSCWGFVDKTNGNILKAAGWNAPAKHARGSIFDKSTWRNMGPYGPAYLR